MPANQLETDSTIMRSRPELSFEDWGLVEYELALKRQLHYVQEVQAGNRVSTVIFCTHPPVVTLGRASKESEYKSWRGPVVSISRGGKATYHGPSQLVVYPILDLNQAWSDRKPRDIVGYLRILEAAIIHVLGLYDIEAEGRSFKARDKKSEATEETGVWVGDRKIASLGIGVRRWVSFHGAAINLDHDSQAFQGLKPCGFQPSVMVSLEELLKRPIDRVQFSAQLSESLVSFL